MRDKSPGDSIDQISKVREAANLLIECELCLRGIEEVVVAHGMVLRNYFNSRTLYL